MEKLRHVNARRVLDKLAVPSEPGLTNAQLMLTNHDLKPGEHQSHVERVLGEEESANSNRQWNRNAANGVLGILWDSGLQIHSTSYVPETDHSFVIC